MNKREDKRITDQDRKLLDAINEGDSDLFNDLVHKYEGKLYNFGLKVCKNVNDAEDLVQESFINVFKSMKDFRHETKFKNWLYKIAANVCWKMKRKSRFAPEQEISIEEFLPSDHKSVDKKSSEWASAPVDHLLNRELSARIKEGVDKLPEKYKLVLILRDMEGFSTEETSNILSLTVQNVKVRLHRARLFLREELKEFYGNK